MMNAIMVSVDYSDLLRVTLPYNRHHFDRVMVVTSKADAPNVEAVARDHNVEVYATDAFYEGGAVFNKWKALEQGLDKLGRQGWLCLMDADVLWPNKVTLDQLQPGYLYTPYRRMAPWPLAIGPNPACPVCRGSGKVSNGSEAKLLDTWLPCPANCQGQYLPTETNWIGYPRHRQEVEFAGYSQMFHCDDPALGPAPWHEINWAHAGGADSMFQRKWSSHLKVRPDWDVLHLGPSGTNWCGRASPYQDGTQPVRADDKVRQLRNFVRSRRHGRPDPFAGEKIRE